MNTNTHINHPCMLFELYVSHMVLKNIMKKCKQNTYRWFIGITSNVSYVCCSVDVFTYIKKFFRQHKKKYKIKIIASPPLFEDDVKELTEILSK